MTDLTPTRSAELWNEIAHRVTILTGRTAMYSTRNRIANEVIDLIDLRCAEYLGKLDARELADPLLVFEVGAQARTDDRLPTRHWYVAVCCVCWPEASLAAAGRQPGEMPFLSRGERDAWIVDHAVTGHERYLVTSTDPADGPPFHGFRLSPPQPNPAEGG